MAPTRYGRLWNLLGAEFWCVREFPTTDRRPRHHVSGGKRGGVGRDEADGDDLAFDFDDLEMRLSKSGDFERDNSQRWNANNSAVWPGSGLTQLEITKQMLQMVESGRGEPGIFNRQGRSTFPRRGESLMILVATPCGEILLRPYEFCNLSIAIARADDTYESLKEKVEVAAIIGTIQSLATHFPGLRPMWKENCEDERLLGWILPVNWTVGRPRTLRSREG